MKAKIKNNELIYDSIFMLIESIQMWVSYPTEEMLTNDGFKDVEYIETSDFNKPDFEDAVDKIIVYIKIENT